MRRCTSGVLPETYASIKFDEKGVCSACKQIERKNKIDLALKK